MKAAVITTFGGPEVLELQDVGDPSPGPFELLVQVEASALNRADLLQRMGHYPAPAGAPAMIPGLEIAGTVAAVGPHVTRFEVGDRVMSLVGGGAAATLAVVHEREAMRAPAGLSITDVASLPEAFITAWDAVVLQGGLKSGQWLAVDAVGSGVGTAATQIARALGARSVGSSRTAAKLDAAREYGLDHGVHGDPAALAAATPEVTGGGAAVALELVGGPTVGAMLGALRPRGTLVLVGLLAGLKAEIFLPMLLRSRLHLVGTVLRSRPIEEKLAIARAFEDQVVPLFEGEAPRLRPVVDKVFGLSEIVDAHRHMASNASFGKIVLDHSR